jgi:cbb3-type cytochrome oxidase maturation protein
MSVVFVVLPLAVLIALGALLAFIWAARHGQFDDLDTPAVRMLQDDTDVPPDAQRGEASDGNRSLGAGNRSHR